MKTTRLTLLLPGVTLLAAAASPPPTASVRVALDQPGAAVPATLHGIFLEEINNAFDGGLYAELIQNRSFEEGVLPPGMKLVKQPDGSLKMELESLPPGVPQEKCERGVRRKGRVRRAQGLQLSPAPARDGDFTDGCFTGGRGRRASLHDLGGSIRGEQPGAAVALRSAIGAARRMRGALHRHPAAAFLQRPPHSRRQKVKEA